MQDYRVRFVGVKRAWESEGAEIMAEIERVLSQGDLIMREDLGTFEQSVADYVGSKHAVGMNSGTDTMFLTLKALGIGTGDEILTVSHTFVASIAVIHHSGATPILVDISLDDQLMDVDAMEKSLTERTRAIIPVHLNGRLTEMNGLMAFAERNNLAVIEDAAQAWGTRLNGKHAGTFGIAGSFSLYPFKTLGLFGDGGIMVTDDDDLADELRLLRDHSQRRGENGFEILGYGWNSRLDNVQAAVGNCKLPRLPYYINRRREIAAAYDYGLQGVEGIDLPPRPSEGDYFDTYQNYVIRSNNRDALFEHLKSSGIETLISWAKPTHSHPALGLDNFDLPNTDQISREVISLPMFPELRSEEVEYVCESVESFYA